VLVRVVVDVLTTDSLGRPVESIPVREVSGDDVDVVGTEVDAVEIEESDDGIPVRFVDALVVQDSIGRWIDVLPVVGVEDDDDDDDDDGGADVGQMDFSDADSSGLIVLLEDI
jgi:hypothetical protein